MAVVLLFTAFGWFFFYSRDLPDPRALASFAPAVTASVSDPCLKTTQIAIPYESIGGNLRGALSAAEVSENDPGVVLAMYHLFTDEARLHRATLSFQVSRTMCYAPSKPLERQLAEIRTASHLERHFSRQELFTIYVNRVYFGQGLIGVQSASQYFFHKNPGDLGIVEAALLAGLAKSPSYYSPVKHSDRAMTRRNEVIEAMLQSGTITASQAEAAKAVPLGIVAHGVAPNVQ